MISVIVPVYKAEKYLQRCIDSILSQSYTDFELLLIDDGSPDNCGVICDEYAVKDSRVRVFHKENGGVSSARNLGLDHAKGDWVSFIDSDDWVETNYLESFTAVLDSDFIIGGVRLCSSTKTIELKDSRYPVDMLIDFINANKGGRINSPWGNLLRRCIISGDRLRFDENVRFAEDIIFNLQYLCHCNSIRTISNCGYNYWDYEISNEASSKYNLSIDEVNYTLSKILSLNTRLGRMLGGEISAIADYVMLLGMIPAEKRCDRKVGEEFYAMCVNLGIVKNRHDYYNSKLCSPVFAGIANLKCYYERGLYDKGKEIFVLLHSYTRDIEGLKFPYKDFYFWYALIRIGKFTLSDFFLRLYFFLKKVFQNVYK